LLLHGLGVFEFQDRMASRCRKKVDIFMDCKQKARRFGVRRYVVLVKLA
jgi:3D (Asp-Asp-Asp) domain-containing protein